MQTVNAGSTRRRLSTRLDAPGSTQARRKSSILDVAEHGHSLDASTQARRKNLDAGSTQLDAASIPRRQGSSYRSGVFMNTFVNTWVFPVSVFEG